MTKVVIDFPEWMLWQLFMIAHEKDITLNKLVNIILRDYLKETKCLKKTK